MSSILKVETFVGLSFHELNIEYNTIIFLINFFTEFRGNYFHSSKFNI